MSPHGPAAVSISTVAWDGYGLEAALDGAAQAGFAFVEPAFIAGYVPFEEADFEPPAARRLLHAMETRHLKVRAVSAHMDLGAPGAAERLARRIGFAAEIGARYLITNAGPAQSRDVISRRIADATALLERAGVVLALENPGHGHRDLLPDAAAGAAFLDAIDADAAWVGLNVDLGNVLTYNGSVDPVAEIAAAGPRLAHLHCKDVAERDGDWVFVPIGEGDVDYRRALAALPTDLPLSLEMPLRLRRPGKADPKRAEVAVPRREIAAAVRRAKAFVDEAARRRNAA